VKIPDPQMVAARDVIFDWMGKHDVILKVGAINDLAREMIASRPAADESAKPVVPWRCFHCDEIFSDADAAREHFGPNEMHEPVCQIDVAKYREMEEIVRRHVSEDTDLHREIYRMQAKHFTDLRHEEEKGYARGLEDGRKYPIESADESAKPDLIRARYVYDIDPQFPDLRYSPWQEVQPEQVPALLKHSGTKIEFEELFRHAPAATVASKEAVTLTIEAAEKMGKTGAPHSEPERLLFEAYMRGHCWHVEPWDAVRGCYGDVQTRMLFGVWRDRAVLGVRAVTLSAEEIIEIGRRYGLWTLLSDAEGRMKFVCAIHAILAQRDASKAEGQ
jgi:hypothetical protein